MTSAYNRHISSIFSLWMWGIVGAILIWGTIGCKKEEVKISRESTQSSIPSDSISKKVWELQLHCQAGFTPELVEELKSWMVITDSLDNSYGRVVTRMNLGFYEVEDNNDYLSGLRHFRDAYEIASKHGEEKLEATVACNIALLEGLRGYSDGLPYAYAAFRYGEKSGDVYMLRAASQTIAMLEEDRGNYSIALEFARKAHDLLHHRGVADKVAILTAYAASENGLGNDKEATDLFRRAIADSVGERADSRIYLHLKLGEFLISKKRYREAIDELHAGEVLGEKLRYNSRRQQLLSSLMKSYEMIGETEMALYYQKEINRYMRATFDETREREMLRLHNNLEEGSLNQELKRTKTSVRRQNWVVFGLICVVLIAAVACLYFLRKGGRARRTAELLRLRNKSQNEKLKNTLEEIRALKSADTRKYKGPSLTDEGEQEIFNKLESLMKEDRAFLDPALNKEKLARLCLTNEAYLSQVINHLGNSSVTEYINRHRVMFAVNLIEQSSDINLTELPERSGFNSSATFYRAFKSVMGMTPAQYQKSSCK